MLWLTRQERWIFTGLGLAVLLAFGALTWQKQRVPLRVIHGPPSSQGRSWDEALEEARRIDINGASVAEWERLPGIGPTTALRIVEYRQAHGPFQNPEDLLHVKGIGPKTYEGIKDYVKTGDQTPF